MSKTDTTNEKVAANQNHGISETGKQWIKDNGYDGHSIYMVSAIPFADLGLSEQDRVRLTREFKSDTSNPKTTIFKDGKIVTKTEGVYLLDLWYMIAQRLKVDEGARMFNGRGSQARCLCDSIIRQLE